MSAPPDTIKVGLVEYAVHLAPGSDQGSTNSEPPYIQVDPDLSPLGLKRTMFHELIHAAAAEGGLRAWLKHDEDHEELLVALLEAPLYAALAENPNLRRFLFA